MSNIGSVLILQDPSYSELEEKLLESRSQGHIRCVSDPEAFLMIDGSTLVFSIGTYPGFFMQMNVLKKLQGVIVSDSFKEKL